MGWDAILMNCVTFVDAGRVFESAAGVPILVGRNKRENEQLSLRIGRHPDVWFHAREVPGAHVVLRMSVVAPRKKDGKKDGKKPGAKQLPAAQEDCMQMAADLVSAPQKWDQYCGTVWR